MDGNLLIYNIGLLATPTGLSARRGAAQAEITLIPSAYILIRDGVIAEIGQGKPNRSCPEFDAGGSLVTPGLIDCHTHLIFGGWRQHEFGRKLAGATYLEILKSGGGILSTVDATRAATAGELYAKAFALLTEALSYGVTTLEAKSGYGLDTENEIKSLEVIRRLNESHPVDVIPTFMGAHAVPRERKDDRARYINELCRDMLPAVAKRGLAEFFDVFCEEGAFSLEESRQILETAKALDLGIKIHAEEINDLGGARLAAELGCVSAEHLIKIVGGSIQILAKSQTVAVCLPCTSFYLNEGFAPARRIVDAGGAVAVATDFNPGSSPNLNLQLAMNMACVKYRLLPAEALCAVTLNAAAAINRAGTVGSIEPGKRGDIVIWNAPDLDYIFYRYGGNLVKNVIKDGNII